MIATKLDRPSLRFTRWFGVAVFALFGIPTPRAAALTEAEIDSAVGRAGGSVLAVTTKLASEELEGRNNLTEGSDEAQAYLIPRLREIGVGLVGGGTDDASYRQSFPQGTNLLAVIPGRELPDEYVIVGAHYDHLGVSSRGTVFNGATDNAAGTAAALAVGEAIRSLPEAPRRSIVIALWDAEEDGLLGSLFYVENPIVPLEKTVAYVNFDIQGSNLTPALARTSFAISSETGGDMFRKLVSDATEAEAARGPGPSLHIEELSYIFGQLRSDYANFVAVEVPTVFFSDATGACYHTAGDDTRRVDFGKLGEQTRSALRVTITLAEADETPTFVPPNPGLATYEDAVVLNGVLQRGRVDLGLFRTSDRKLLRDRFADLQEIVRRGPESFGAEDVQTMLATAIDTLGAIESSLGCISYFAPDRDTRGPLGASLPRRLPRR